MTSKYSEVLKLIGDETDRRRLQNYIWVEIVEATSYLSASAGLSQRVWHLRCGEEAPKCGKCGGLVKWCQRSKEYRSYCSNICARTCPNRIERSRRALQKTLSETDVLERRAKTNLLKYGSVSYLGTKEARAALKRWSQDNLGVAHPSQSPVIEERKRKTSLARFGYRHAAQSPEVKSKTETFFKNTYGAHPMTLPEIKERQASSNVSKYGTHYKRAHISPEVLDVLEDEKKLSDMNANMTLAEIANNLGVSPSLVGKAFRNLNLEYVNHSRSAIERDIEAFIISRGFKVSTSNRKLISPLEIDIVVPSRSLAIEVNGSFWHSEKQGADSNYHVNKTKACLAVGYKLMHIQDHYWATKRPIVESRLLYALGGSTVLSARKCELEVIESNLANAFMEDNHLQGACPHSHAIGLVQNGVLVACMTFGKPRFNKRYDWELIRYAPLLNHTVVGGSSKIMKKFADTHSGSMVTYADRQYGEGHVYYKMGFAFVRETKPSYSYTMDYRTFHNRMTFQKHKLGKILEEFEPHESEWQNMSRHGWDRVWDCGTNMYEKFLGRE